MAGRSESVNYYAVLGLCRCATAEAIRGAYLKLTLKWHPDKVGKKDEASSKFYQQVQEAYKVLSDPTRKALYDAGFYDPILDNDLEGDKLMSPDVLEQLVAMMDREKEEKELIADMKVLSLKQEPKKKKGLFTSSSMVSPWVRVDVAHPDGESSPAVRVDVTFNDGGGSSRAAGRRGGPASSSSRPRRRMLYQAPIFGARLKFE